MLKFTKMEGLGNDYVYVDCTQKSKEEIDNIAKLAKKVSNRNFGVGSDGLILICKSDVADFKMQMYNQDGSQAEMCGNGIRCVGKYVYDKGLTNKNVITVETLAGIKELDMIVEDGKVSAITVNMGAPILEEKKIPCHADYTSGDLVSHVQLKVLDKEFDFTCVSMGNPHAIAVIDSVDTFDIEKYGKLVETDKHFPQKTNVEFIEVVDETTIKMRVWERGAGETLACGTGASASVVACTINNLIKHDSDIKVQLLGGDLSIKWDEEVYMTGPAKFVFEGELLDD
jgi:diaminopimelate epimerase